MVAEISIGLAVIAADDTTERWRLIALAALVLVSGALAASILLGRNRIDTDGPQVLGITFDDSSHSGVYGSLIEGFDQAVSAQRATDFQLRQSILRRQAQQRPSHRESSGDTPHRDENRP